jgi:hypothetical protein
LFSFATLAGSSLGSSMSLTQEIHNFAPSKEEVTSTDGSNNESAFGLPSAALAISVPVAAAICFAGGEGFTDILSVAGSFGTPLLYGAIPVAMAWSQRQKQPESTGNLVPAATLPCLGGLSIAFMGQELFQQAGEVMAATV